MIYTDFESVLVPEDNEKQNPDESYTNKYQKYVVCSNGYKLELTDDKFRKSFKLYLGENLVSNFINHVIEENKYSIDFIKKVLIKNLQWLKKNSKFWICHTVRVEADVKIRDHCHITGKYRASAHRDCNINVKLNHKIPILFHNLKTMICILLWKN